LPAITMFYRRNLPHWYPDVIAGCFLFVTWRLADSLPANLVRGRRTIEPQNAGRAFAIADRCADRATSGPLWLNDPRIALLVKDALHRGEHRRRLYTLRAWVIMPNHVHVLIEPKVSLPQITRWLKGSTARQANQILRRTGYPFWQDESYDHSVRTREELDRVVRYIESNPVNAGFVEDSGDWPWSSASSVRRT
jgi:REP element-mobilizing transposase RayT